MKHLVPWQAPLRSYSANFYSVVHTKSYSGECLPMHSWCFDKKNPVVLIKKQVITILPNIKPTNCYRAEFVWPYNENNNIECISNA